MWHLTVIILFCSLFHSISTQKTHLQSLANVLLSGEHYCSGSILGERWILTAGTCCAETSPGDLVVRVAGQDDLLLSGFYLHPAFDVFTLSDNICLLELESEVLLGDSTGPATLPPTSGEDYPGGTQCVEAGWEEGLEDAWSVTIMSDTSCGFGPFICGSMDVNANDPCKGNTGIDTCLLNIIYPYLPGGPLTCRDTLAGLLSYRTGCLPGGIGVYTRVDTYINWISSIMGEVE